jgi:ethanolamine utilization protein EutN
MQVCTVVGHIWSTKKEASLEGFKFMLVREGGTGGAFVAADLVGAGIGEEVLVVSGSTARCAAKTRGDSGEAPIDAAIVGIIDTAETGKQRKK